MKKLLLMAVFLGLVGCGKSVVKIPDNRDIIDSNTIRIQLLEASQSVQDARLAALETGLASTNVLVQALLSTQIDLEEFLELIEGLEQGDGDFDEDLYEELEDLMYRVEDLEDIVEEIIYYLMDMEEGDDEEGPGSSCSITSVESSTGNNSEAEVTCGPRTYTFTLHNVNVQEED